MNIIYASDDNFAEILGISMLSLFENNRKADEINVFILDSGISDMNKNKLIWISDSYSRKIFFLNISELLDMNMKQERGSLATFSRLYAAQLLPEDTEKALYLDCDILVLRDLSSMYNTQIGEYYGAAVKDCVSAAHKKSVGLTVTDNYFNAGVYLMNVRKWRNDNITEKFVSFSEKYKNSVPYADQGILNGVASAETIALDLKYNCYTILYDFQYKNLISFRKPSGYYSESVINEAKSAPAVVHFTTCFLSLRPWVEDCKHPYADEWLKYKAMSPWNEHPLRQDNRSLKKKAAVKIYKLLPERMAASAAGLLHAVIMPRFKR